MTSTKQTGSSGSWKERNCPNMRTCWSFSWNAYNPVTSDKAAMVRRLSMCLTLFVRTFLSILGICRNAYGTVVVSVVVGVILTILNFFFIGWCLAKIGEAQGERRVFGKLVGRFAFDIFLGFCAIVHIGLLLASFMAWDSFGGAGLNGTWLAMWVLIFAVAWVATWAPEGESAV
ncbi:hypothetical protein ACJ41O_000617 [Fusarium nematophilum]